MNFISKVADMFSTHDKKLSCNDGFRSSESADAREAASRFARGNVPVQTDAFVTTEDLERERVANRAINFR